jgi:hypothetical protein
MDTQTFKIGEKVTYQDVDMESYSRGYGINYETKNATIVSVCYKLSNGEVVEAKKLRKISDGETQKSPSTGQPLPAGQTGAQ